MRSGYRAMLVDRLSTQQPTGLRLVVPHTLCACIANDQLLAYPGHMVEWDVEDDSFSYRCGNTLYQIYTGSLSCLFSGINIRGTNGYVRYKKKVWSSKFSMELFRGPVRFSVHVDHPGEEDELGIEIVARESITKKFSIPFDWHTNPLQLVTYAIQLINMM